MQKKLDQQINKIQVKMEELENEENEQDIDDINEDINDTIKINKAQIEILCTENNEYELQLTQHQEHLSQINLNVNNDDEIENEIEIIQQQLKIVTEEIEANLQQNTSIIYKINKHNNKQHDYQQAIDFEQNKLQDINKELKDSQYLAEQISSQRLITEFTYEQLKQNFEKLKIELDEHEHSMGGTAEYFEEIFYAKEAEYSQLTIKIQEFKAQTHLYKKAIKNREKEWQRFRRFIAAQATQFFTENLTQQGHDGTLSFDHNKAELKLVVNVKASLTGGDKGATNTKSLSGGERSFSTLSFIIALGDTMSSPFRAMDEFDVFMDSVNRKISITMLVKSAESNKNKQYIFVTPQDITQIQDIQSSQIRIFKLKDPDRSQGIINFASPSQQSRNNST